MIYKIKLSSTKNVKLKILGQECLNYLGHTWSDIYQLVKLIGEKAFFDLSKSFTPIKLLGKRQKEYIK